MAKLMYILSLNGKLIPTVYQSLFDLCSDNELSYSSASKGKRIFLYGDNVFRITEVELKKIKRK